MTRARARLALREAVRFHLFDPNVGLIDFGHPEHDGRIAEDQLAIRIHVRKKLTDIALEAAVAAGYTRPIPAMIGGFPTDVPEGVYHLHVWSWRPKPWASPAGAPTAHANPLRGGVSISDEYHIAAGTLGGKVIDRTTGAEMILSNWHVLVADWSAQPGQRVEQPGRLDGGALADTVAALTRDAMAANLDAAVATLDGSRPLINDQLGLGAIVGVGRAELGMELVKSGRTTGVTYARVTAVEGTAKIAYGTVERVIRQVITIEPDMGSGQVSAPGDSGSLWLDAATMRAIGLHFAGSDMPERALALDMPSVLDALNVDIATGREAALAPQIDSFPRRSWAALQPGDGALRASRREPQIPETAVWR
jgi:endonuclease G